MVSEISPPRTLNKAKTGIPGFDDVAGGGLPEGRPTLVCGYAGCGKTLFAMEFLVRGATEFNEPGVFIAFEESESDLVENVASIGFDLVELMKADLIRLDQILVPRSEMNESGEYDLEALFIRIGYAIDSIGAKRVVLDTLETLFVGFASEAILRCELQRLFRWLKDRGITAIITAERAEGSLTRQGIEEYVSDCVILLDHRVIDQVSTRRLRIVKYRGSVHGTNEYPFLIDEDGIMVMPLSSTCLDYETSADRISTGVPALDDMMSGLGVFRGSSVLVSGTTGSGKSSLAAHFAFSNSAIEKCVYFAFEESPAQIVRNMRSIGLDLAPRIESGRLEIVSARPSHYGLEMHLATMLKKIETFSPQSIVLDPLTSFVSAGSESDAQAMLIRLVDYLKGRGITSYFTGLTKNASATEAAELTMSSLMDTWMLVQQIEADGERNRLLYVLKSRGMAHSNQVREFLITSAGIQLREVYLGPQGVLTGTARIELERREATEAAIHAEESAREQTLAEGRRKVIEAQIASLTAELVAGNLESERRGKGLERSKARDAEARALRARSRGYELNGDL
ncbi:circadian clock protein KaiC [Fimbriimonas ginsengisoli]|uniref:non-specific serine/threonine protein kinase n=1 Tax=Fimbriimonas ginsengisoli Gsoil 348 TaxID=661478 RepID=A0A068NQR5_FIMGI|nr:circadian clock protein KaiC [Fimbriimonas ginsengisoli]AIE85898.1 Circadian clock protein KaiC [Fimbriimonas ginsengisoli Gsoil 348]